MLRLIKTLAETKADKLMFLSFQGNKNNKMLSQCSFLILLVLVLPSLLNSASVDSNGPNNVHGKARVLSERKLSDKEHFEGDHHDADYDHEAFLGADEAREFDHLTPEESRSRLAKIVDKIDSNEDGYVTLDEMRDWIRFTQQRYISEDVDRQWAQHNLENKETITWAEYRKLVYGFLDEDVEDGHHGI